MNKKVLILEGIYLKRRGVINKDVNAGLGTCTNIGDSFLAKILERIKKNGISLPLLDFAYFSAILKKQGHEVFYKKVSSADVIKNFIASNKITDVVFHPGLVDYTNEIRIAQEIRTLFPNIRLGAFGPFSSLYPNLLTPYFNWIIAGEFEALLLKYEFSKLDGIIHSPGYLDDLDILPFPDWDIFSDTFFSYKPIITATPFYTIQGSRGCPMSCGKYCPYPTSQGKKWRARSIESVVNEIKNNIRLYNMKGFLFRDAFFSLNKARTIEFAKAMIKENLQIEWGCETRLDSLNKEIITLLYEAGLRALNLGIESSNEEILKEAGRKPFSGEFQKDLISYCYKLGIKVNTFFILGLMEDNENSINNTIQHACTLKSFSCQFTINTPLPGTEYFEEMKDILTDTNLEHYDNNTPVVKHPHISAVKLKKLQEKAFLRYYFRPMYAARFFRWKLRDSFQQFKRT